MKYLKLGLGLVVLGLVALLFWLKTPGAPKADVEKIRETAANYDARIVRDDWGVAHIFGKTDPDTSFGLGYSHAEDDWETIQDVIMTSRGVSAQYHGKDLAPMDFLFDLMKVLPAIEEKADQVSPAARAMAKAYADGLSLWASENRDRVLPGILPMTETDVLAGYTWATPFFYRMDEEITKLMTSENAPQVSPWKTLSYWDVLPEAVRGSNAFAIAPSRSADGHTRLIVNSHQPFVGPYAWFEAHVVSEDGLNLAGAGFPGTPILAQGVTPTHGWAHTVNKPDLVDIYKLETDKAKKPKKYKLDGEWLDFEISKAEFRVKLTGPFSLPIKKDMYWSKHGPVLETSHGFYAVRFSGLGEVGALDQWYAMSKAKSLDEWKAAIAQNGVLSFNIVYADKDGNIGEIYNAKMPKRIDGPKWRDTLPGDDSSLIWQSYRNVDELPQIYNPDSGWLFSANSSPFFITDKTDNNLRENYPESYGIEARMTNRAKRSLALLENDESITEAELLKYRADARYAPDSNLRQMIETIKTMTFETEDMEKAQRILSNWKGSTEIQDRRTALAVLTGMHARGFEMIEDLMPPEEAMKLASDQLIEVFGRVDPPWGDVNRLRRGDVDLPLRGGPDTLRAIYGHYDNFIENKGLVAVAGDSHIMIADWDENGKLDLESIHQFGAATLDKSSKHYSDQAHLFAKGEYKTMPMTLEDVLPLATRDYYPGK